MTRWRLGAVTVPDDDATALAFSPLSESCFSGLGVLLSCRSDEEAGLEGFSRTFFSPRRSSIELRFLFAAREEADEDKDKVGDGGGEAGTVLRDDSEPLLTGVSVVEREMGSDSVEEAEEVAAAAADFDVVIEDEEEEEEDEEEDEGDGNDESEVEPERLRGVTDRGEEEDGEVDWDGGDDEKEDAATRC